MIVTFRSMKKDKKKKEGKINGGIREIKRCERRRESEARNGNGICEGK